MAELLSSKEMRAIEARAIDSGQVTGLELMERAGRGVVEAVFEEWPALAEGPHRAVVLCGPGNNGGDGFVIARLLKEAGWQVAVYLYGDAEKLPPDAKVNYDRWAGIGTTGALADWERSEGWGCDLLIDALFGIGLKRGLKALGNLFWNMEDMVDCFAVEPGHKIGRPAIVAVDMPSGICADSGREFPHEEEHHRFSAAAHLTVTFHRPKLGHFLAEGPRQCGKLAVKDIGLSEEPARKGVPREHHVNLCEAVHPDWLRKDVEGHKYGHGHALIFSGGVGKGGAARLAARGALRIGAGLVTLACPPAALIENAAQLNAIMLRSVKDAAALAEVLGDARINAICIGPGLGTGEREAALVAAAVRAKHTPYVVFDADALTLVAQDQSLFDALHDRCILTPHGGEFARLFPDIAESLAAPATKGPAYSKVDATRDAAKRAGCTVLFKGPDSVIAHPDGSCSVHSAQYDRAAPWLATAGSGDVLAGMITGLLARGQFTPLGAAGTAAWLHVECARSFGPGLIAEDLPEQLPKVLRGLGL
ncbi:bifunctional NAD(P)H-hydrate repair enzyme [Sulfitobacter porphyrae]|nr:bifunctional NAD(P)H-hydrate repair enzyme [Sulfitobacter porphyrae]